MTTAYKRLAILLVALTCAGAGTQAQAYNSPYKKYQQTLRKDNILCKLGNTRYCFNGKIGKRDRIKMQRYCRANPKACRR